MILTDLLREMWALVVDWWQSGHVLYRRGACRREPSWRWPLAHLERRVEALEQLPSIISRLEGEQVFTRKMLGEQVMLDRKWIEQLMAQEPRP